MSFKNKGVGSALENITTEKESDLNQCCGSKSGIIIPHPNPTLQNRKYLCYNFFYFQNGSFICNRKETSLWKTFHIFFMGLSSKVKSWVWSEKRFEIIMKGWTQRRKNHFGSTPLLKTMKQMILCSWNCTVGNAE